MVLSSIEAQMLQSFYHALGVAEWRRCYMSHSYADNNSGSKFETLDMVSSVADYMLIKVERAIKLDRWQ